MYLKSGLGDVCTAYDDLDNCIAWTTSPGGGSYSGPNLNNVEAPGFVSGQTGGSQTPSIAQQQQLIANQLGIPVTQLPGYQAPASSSSINPLYVIIGALGLVVLVAVVGGRR